MPRSTKASFTSPNPTHDDIARCAYDIFVARGSVHGSDVEHWLEAERLLLAALGDGAMAVAPAMAADAPPPRARGGKADPSRATPSGPRRRKPAVAPKAE
jgi:hypothetical protein